MLILRIFIFIYGLLTIIAVGEEARATQIQWTHALYILFSLTLIWFSIRLSPEYLLYFGLIGLVVFVILYGLATHTIQWSHIFVRIVLTGLIIFFWHRLS